MMSKREKQIYLIVGQLVCKVTGAMLFMGVPIAVCYLVGLVSHIILGG